MPAFDPVEAVETEDKEPEAETPQAVELSKESDGKNGAIDPSALKSVFGDDEQPSRKSLKNSLSQRHPTSVKSRLLSLTALPMASRRRRIN
jgi:hypothetical protein